MKSHEIKDILEERRIEVSESSWEQLASQLDTHDKKQKRTYFYLPYAACLAVILGAIVFMVVKNNDDIHKASIVETEKSNKPTKEQTIPVLQKENINEEIVKEAFVSVEKTKEQPQKNRIISKGNEQPIKKVQPTTQDKYLEVALQKETQNAVAETKEIPEKIKTVLPQKEILVDPNKALKASILALSETEKVAITDAEINQLLQQAQESFSELKVKKEVVTITSFATADDLLEEVELELDRSFKQKVFELIKNNIQKGKTVIANRD